MFDICMWSVGSASSAALLAYAVYVLAAGNPDGDKYIVAICVFALLFAVTSGVQNTKKLRLALKAWKDGRETGGKQ